MSLEATSLQESASQALGGCVVLDTRSGERGSTAQCGLLQLVRFRFDL